MHDMFESEAHHARDRVDITSNYQLVMQGHRCREGLKRLLKLIFFHVRSILGWSIH